MRVWLKLLPLAIAASLVAGRAEAVPAYTEQTAQPCTSCHIGGFGPQLTPFGRQFKLDGYTLRAGDKFTLPISAAAVASYVHTQKDLPEPPAEHFSTNNNFNLDEAQIFVAGGIGQHFGGFIEIAYDGAGRAVALDHTDLRATTHATIGGSDVLLGLSLNDAVGVQEVWNTLATWGFPYTASDLAPEPEPTPIIDGFLETTVIGLSAYAYWNSSIYTEFGLYVTPSHDYLQAMGLSTDESGILRGAAPYFRVAYQKDFGNQNIEIGAFGFFPRIYPEGEKSFGTNRYTDLGADASYQFLGDANNAFTVNARYVNEQQDLNATFLEGGAASKDNDLSEVRLDASYYWKGMVGGTVGAFDVWGSRDALLYADNRTLQPDSSGFIFQLDYTPFGGSDAPVNGRFGMRMGIQYFVYTKFDGASSNFDGLSRDASDNNTLRIFVWVAL